MKRTGISVAAIILVLVVHAATACDFAAQYAWGNLILPEIEFRQTTLSNVVAVLNEFIAKSVTNVPPPTIRVAPDANGPITHNSEFGSGEATPPQGIPTITYTAKYIRLGCALKMIAAMGGLDCEVNEKGAVFKIPLAEKDAGITKH